MAERLTAELNSVISLSDPVHSISQNNNRVTVHYGDANSLNAKTAIVAIPPPLRQRITSSPDLPTETRSFLQRSPIGSMIKLIAIYKKTFCREKKSQRICCWQSQDVGTNR